MLRTPPAASGCVQRTLRLPASPAWLALAAGALVKLTEEWIWEQSPGGLTPSETAELFLDIYTDFVQSLGGCMTGEIVPFVSAALPIGFLACDGATHNRVDYPGLYAAIDTFYHVDADTFTVPDLRGRVLIGQGQGSGLSMRTFGDVGGVESVAISEAQMPAHTHWYTPPILNLDLEDVGVPDIQAAGIGLSTQTSSTGSGQAHENMSPFCVIRYGIRT